MTILASCMSTVIVIVILLVVVKRIIVPPRNNRHTSVYDARAGRAKEAYGTYSFGDFFTQPQAMMPDYFDGTRVRCTDACVYRIRNQGVYIDNDCYKMCGDGDQDKYQRELIQSIESGHVAYDHS